ncbi:MAG: hypothetical protein ACRECY_06145, partial [Phyllobacterium sp.]
EGEVVEDKFPDYPLILYVNDVDQCPHYLAAIEARPDVFVKLHTDQWTPRADDATRLHQYISSELSHERRSPMITNILFGIHSEYMQEIKNILEDILGIEMEAREGFHVGDYYCFGVPESLLCLQYNEDFEGEVVEDKFPDYPLILYVNDVDQCPHYLAAIEARPDVFVKLHTDQWTPRSR